MVPGQRSTACSSLLAAVRHAFLGAILACAGGCTHRVEPPAGVASPTSVYLVDHGRTASVVLPHDEALVRYSYGEWQWYALNRTGPFRGSGALWSDTHGTLGRDVFEAQRTLDAVRAAIRLPVQNAWELEVERVHARALASELDALFRRASGEAVYNPLMGQTFVPHPEPYSLRHNSNHVAADWLRRLGCRVEMHGPFSRWRVVGGR